MNRLPVYDVAFLPGSVLPADVAYAGLLAQLGASQSRAHQLRNSGS